MYVLHRQFHILFCTELVASDELRVDVLMRIGIELGEQHGLLQSVLIEEIGCLQLMCYRLHGFR